MIENHSRKKRKNRQVIKFLRARARTCARAHGEITLVMILPFLPFPTLRLPQRIKPLAVHGSSRAFPIAGEKLAGSGQ